MRISALAAVGLSSIASALVRRISVHHVVHERRDTLGTEEWKRQARADRGEVLPIRIALKERNLENAERYILDVSHPESPNFGKHWTAEQVANTFRPTEETNERVVSWLLASGIEPSSIFHSAGHNWIQFDAAVEDAEVLFDTTYHTFEHSSSGRSHAACDSYSLPHDLRDHIEFVLPTVHLGNLQHHSKPSQAKSQSSHELIHRDTTPEFTGLTGLKNCDQIITIECLRAVYNFSAGSTNHSGNQMGIGEWDQYLYRPDLKVFFAKLTKPVIPNDTFPEFISIDGGKRVYGSPKGLVNFIIEASIDFQTAYSIIYPQNTRWYAVGDGVNVNSVGTFNIFLDALDASYCTYMGGDTPQDPKYPDPKPGGYKGPLQCGGAPKSNVIAISFGQEEVNLPPSYETRQCHEYMKLGLQGVSVIFASGDSGVAQSYNAGFPNKCLAVHSNRKSVNGTRFSPGFPSTCPYVTSVGATALLSKSIYGGEMAVGPEFYSGGGFSNVFAMPSYQAQAVDHYLTTYPPPYNKTQYNQTGSRAYPDISALGINIALVLNVTVTNYGGGTSAAAQIFGGLVTLLNEARLSAGKCVLGFLNPILYANPQAFNDVTVGSNPGCGTNGFACQPGWDPVTGLGTPNFEKLKTAVLALP